MEGFREIVGLVNTVLWDYILIFALIGIGIYMTVRLKFPQFTRLMPALKKMVAGVIKKEEVEPGKMTPFQALSTAVAAQVGTGNIVGVATAIAAGGPGPAYYIKNGTKSKGLAAIFSITAIFAMGIIGIMVQSNSIAGSVSTAFGAPVLGITIVLAIVVALILMGGMGRIASFAETVVPIMAVAYILGSLVIILMNLGSFVPVLKSIFVGAFTPAAIGGGVLGITLQHTIRFGLARGLFSNEAGLGSTPHSHAVADTDHPAEQGFTAIVGVFISTFLICVSTVMVNMVSESYDAGISAAEMTEMATVMTQNGFMAGFGNFGAIFLSICLSFFSLTTIVGWYFFAESNVKFLISSKSIVINGFKALVITSLVVGTLIDATFVWELADMSMGLMAIPSIIALFLLSKDVRNILEDYDSKIALDNVYWEYEYENVEEKKRRRSPIREGITTTIIK